MCEFSDEVREAQSVCALRFDGYKYVDIVGIELNALTKPIVQSLTLFEENNRNFAAFFGLQRYLHKWGGEYLTKYADEHITYDFLFLHLYHYTVPDEYVHEKYCQQWEQKILPNIEQVAATVRQSFRRKGRGKKIAF